MQCVILAAGEGVRMRPLTLNTPKPLLSVLGKPILHHLMKSLPEEIDEFIIVIGYLGEQIKDFFGSEFEGRAIRYVSQLEKIGTYDALLSAKNLINDDLFLVLYADDFFGPLSYKRLVEKKAPAILVMEVDDPRRFGVVLINTDGTVREIEEKPAKPKSNIANCGPSVLTRAIFDYPPKMHAKGEYFLSESVSRMAEHHKIWPVYADWWLPIGFPEDLEKAEEFLKNTDKS